MKPTLFILAGLPGTGKTTLTRKVARVLPAACLRIDTIEQGLRDLCGVAVHGEGYGLAYRLAQENLSLGLSVIADCCNPIGITRDAWEDVARRPGCDFLHVEIVCSDPVEHRRRIETRGPDIAGLPSPSWAEVQRRDYHAWDRPRRVLDTAGKSADEVATEFLRSIAAPAKA